MRRLLLVAALLPLVAAPALADFDTLPKGLPPTGMHTTGVYTPGPPPGIFLDYKTLPVAPSDTLQFVFAFHWPFITSNALFQAQFGLQYDNSEVEITGLNAAGPFAGGANGFATAMYYMQNPSTGVLTATSGCWANPAATTFMMTGSGIYPIFTVTVHVKDAYEDSVNDLMLVSCNLLLSHIATNSYPPYTSYWWSTTVGDVNYGVDIIPEPSTIGLGICGLLAVSGGIWRRRR